MLPLRARTKLLLAYLACALLTFAAPADHLIGGIPQTDEDVQVLNFPLLYSVGLGLI
jgi:hypothetical protein